MENKHLKRVLIFCLPAEICDSWFCGQAAKEYLMGLVRGKEVACTNEGLDKYSRQLSYCYAGEINLNQTMLRNGYAVAYTKFDKVFFLDELLYMRFIRYM